MPATLTFELPTAFATPANFIVVLIMKSRSYGGTTEKRKLASEAAPSPARVENVNTAMEQKMLTPQRRLQLLKT